MGSGSLGIVAFIAALFVMIIVHETGHFLAARAFKIKVEEFFIGFGPRLLSWRRGETEYGLKAILLGGYVRIAGMNPWQPISDDERPRTFGAKPPWQRAIVLVAGSATHLIMGAVIMTFVFAVPGLPFSTTKFAAISDTVGGVPGPAKVAGLAPGDTVLAVDGKVIKEWDDFRAIVQASPGKPLDLLVTRDGRQRTVRVTPVAQVNRETGKEVGVLGITPAFRDPEPLPKAVPSGISYTGSLTVDSVRNIGRIFSPSGVKDVFDSLGGRGARGPDQPMGLIGAGRVAGDVTRAGNVALLLIFFASFIVFVGVINLVPLPPLDGGHLAVLLLEKVRGKPIDMKKVVPVAAVVLTFLTLFMIALIYLDIARPVTAPF